MFIAMNRFQVKTGSEQAFETLYLREREETQRLRDYIRELQQVLALNPDAKVQQTIVPVIGTSADLASGMLSLRPGTRLTVDRTTVATTTGLQLVERQPGVAAEAVVERQVERGAGRGRAGGDDRVGGQPGSDVGRVVGEGVGAAGGGGPDSGHALVADAVVGRDGALAPALVAGQPQPVGAAALAGAIADAEGGAEVEGDGFPG